jgi:hypothetical protein
MPRRRRPDEATDGDEDAAWQRVIERYGYELWPRHRTL